jgi:Phage portal protein, SPP1 Gp6-like
MGVVMAVVATSEEAFNLTETIYWRLRNRRAEIEKQEAYYAGEQSLTFATDEWLKANGARYSEFSDNWCASVVNAIGERTKVTGIKLRGADPMQKDVAANARASQLWDQWNLNELDAQSSQGFLTSFIAKRSYVLVWGDGADAEVTWEHPANVEIQYDWMQPRKRDAALKTWVDDKTEYATLYTPTHLWKWQRPRRQSTMLYAPQSVQMLETGIGADARWVPREVPGEVWPLKNPMGAVPIVEVPNRPLLRGEPVSEIAGVIPKQDAINLLWAYLFFAADYASMPARVLLGSAPPMRKILDELGVQVGQEPIELPTLADSRFMVFSGEHAKTSQWDAAKLDVFTDVIEVLVGHIASQTRTPPTYLISKTGMSNVNGEGLKGSEIGLVKKELEFQTFATPAMRDVFSLIAKAQMNQELAREVRLSTIVWQNPEIRSEAQLADALLKKRQTGYPLEYLMELDGIDPYDMARIKSMIEAEALDPQIEAANRQLAAIANPPVA